MWACVSKLNLLTFDGPLNESMEHNAGCYALPKESDEITANTEFLKL